MGEFADTDGGVSTESVIFTRNDGDEMALRLGVKGIIFVNDSVLLIKERRSDGSTFWTLPGGGLQPNESLSEGLQREFREELNVGVGIDTFVDTCSYHHTSLPGTTTEYFVFRCCVNETPLPNESEGVIDVEWFEIETLPMSTLNQFESMLSRLANQGRFHIVGID